MKKLVALIMIAFLVPATATVALAKNPCNEDKNKFCEDAKATGKDVAECLKAHSAEVSPACKAFLDMPQAERDKERAERKAKKGNKSAEKPAETKPAEKPIEATPPSEPASPGSAESRP
jgi:hypothetical protein